MSKDAPVCVRCGRPVELNREHYELFESMHWLCFHLEYEHDGDPDAACDGPDCPWWLIEVFREALRDQGQEPDAVLERAVRERFTL